MYGNSYGFRRTSVADPDPYVFGPPASGIRKTLIHTSS
jgi:hypothetical protein